MNRPPRMEMCPAELQPISKPLAEFVQNIRDSSSLNYDTDDENSRSDQDTVFSGYSLRHKARQERSHPCTELKNRSQPSFAGLIFWSVGVVLAHMSLEGGHSEHSTEYSLVITYF